MSTTKGSTRMILVHVQKMYKTCTEDVHYVFFCFPKSGFIKETMNN